MRKGDRVRDQIVEAIRTYWAEHGLPPTVRELSLAVGHDPSNVYEHLQRLAIDGKIIWTHGRARGIRLPT